MLIEEVNQDLIIDEVYERLAAERELVRLYEHAIARGLADRFEAIPTIRDRKLEHEQALDELLRRFGRQPDREETAGAALARTIFQPLVAVSERPDASVRQLLQVMLYAELTSLAGWELLLDVCKRAPIDEDVVRAVRGFTRQQKEHVHLLRAYLEQLIAEELQKRGLAAPPAP